MAFQNFSMWRGRLPHWRADDVVYYVTFRHRRPLTEPECHLLLKQLTKPDGRRWDLLIAAVLPEGTELMFKVFEAPSGQPYELAEIVEKAKFKAGKLIIKKSEERWPPFYTESYDRIVRDDAEFEERWLSILDSPVAAELCQEPEHWDGLYVAEAPL